MGEYLTSAVLRAGLRGIALASALLSAAACTIVPRDGPPGEAVTESAEVRVIKDEELAYALVELSPAVVRRAQALSVPGGFSRRLRANAPAEVRVAVGDTLSIQIFEAEAGGLYGSRESGGKLNNVVQLPVQQVDRDGVLSIPYAGLVPVLGRTAKGIETDINERLKGRAIEPQTLVTILDRRGNQVAVTGDVYTPNRFAMDPGGMKLLDAIARAGGPRSPAFETLVVIQRGGVTDSALLTSIVKSPEQNINLRSGDTVFLSRQTRSFIAFGATPPPGSIGGQNNRRFIFEDENLTLAEAIAKAGGLETTRADPTTVFLFRKERREVLSAVGVDVRNFPEPLVPTVYMVDLRKTGGLFLANSFFMQHRDLIFVAEAPVVDVAKFMAIVRSFTLPVADVALSTQRLGAF